MKTLFSALMPILVFTITHVPLKNGIGFASEKSSINITTPLLETRWNLVELSGKKIPVNATSKRMFLVLKSDSTVSGNGGCNAFSGNYSLGNDNEISFGQMVRTNILCAGIDFESKYLNALAKTDHYELKGDTLIFKKQLISLAKFAAVAKQ